MNDEVIFAPERKGYNKEQVNRYIEDMNNRFNGILSDKDREIAKMKTALEETQKELAEITAKYQELNDDRERIASVLLDAQLRAEQILANAKVEAEAEKERLLQEADDKRNLVVERNKVLREMRMEISGLFEGFKKDVQDSYENILKTIDGDLQVFMDNSQKTGDKYSGKVAE